MKSIGEGLTLQEFLKSLGLDDTESGQEREPAKIAPSGKEPLPKSELAKIKPYDYRMTTEPKKINRMSTDEPKVINKVINNDVDNSTAPSLARDRVPKFNNINISSNVVIQDINLISRLSYPARACVRVRDPRAYFKAWRAAKFSA